MQYTTPQEPATFAIGADGRIALAHVDLDYRTRLEPSEALAAALAANAQAA